MKYSTLLAVALLGLNYTAGEEKTVSVDFSQVSTDNLSFVHGTDLGPQCLGYSPFNESNPRFSGPDCGSDMRDLNIQTVRTHDSSLLDWPVLFPHDINSGIDTSEPANYDFTEADKWLSSIVDNGFTPYFRLGTSFNQFGGGLPSDPSVSVNWTALVDVMLHTVMHYTDGWGSNNPSFKGYPIKYFEIWNEPDSSCDWSTSSSCGQFWNRSYSEFYDLVEETVAVLKAYDSSLVIGANGCALPYAPWAYPDPNPYSWGLLDELAARNVPIDFFSWHYYTNNSDLIPTIAGAVRSKLDEVGYSTVEQHITEWNICMNCNEQDSARGAAATAATLTRMIESKVSVATFYPACSEGM